MIPLSFHSFAGKGLNARTTMILDQHNEVGVAIAALKCDGRIMDPPLSEVLLNQRILI
jgi:hypothetical protein